MGRPKAGVKKEKGLIEKTTDAINNILHPDQQTTVSSDGTAGTSLEEAAKLDQSSAESEEQNDENTEGEKPPVESADDSDMPKHQKFDKFKN